MKFEPFQDRLSRDIRNELSRAFGAGVEQGSFAPVQVVADRYLTQDLEACYREYIENRLVLYKRAFEQIKGGKSDMFWRALVLWDLGLFFEVHEILEQEWRRAEGDKKVIVQAMIRAAGAYIKLEYGYAAAAAKMAAKALPVLEKHREFFSRYFEPATLIQGLQDLKRPPPRLLAG